MITLDTQRGRRVVHQATRKHEFSVYQTGDPHLYEVYINKPWGIPDIKIGEVRRLRGSHKFYPLPQGHNAVALERQKSLYDAGWTLCRHYEEREGRTFACG